MESHFSAETGRATKLAYYALCAIGVVYSAVVLSAPLVAPPCDRATHNQQLPGQYQNKDYVRDACASLRYLALGGLTKFECDMCSRVLVSIALGSMIGWERRRADRPAGIRTMAMVCLGACVFTIDSMFAFLDGPMSWDSSRVSAAIPSGVGFLGAASIWKGTSQEKLGSASRPEVHGLTTATSVWLSAAIGILAGGALYVPALFTTIVAVVYLRFAPRQASTNLEPCDASASELEGMLSVPLRSDEPPDVAAELQRSRAQRPPMSRESRSTSASGRTQTVASLHV